MSEAVLDGAKRLVVRARRQQNTCQLINQLPVDIGHEIFRRSLDTDWAGQCYYRGLMRLRLTCRQWHNSIDSDSSFWVLLSNWDPISAWDAILQRNPMLPICMTYTYPYPTRSRRQKYGLPQRVDFLKVAVKEVHRVRSLRFMPAFDSESYLNAGAERKLVEHLISLPAPSLEEVLIDSTIDKARPDLMFRGLAPHLQVVGLSKASEAVWTSFTLQRLQALDVDGGDHLNVVHLVTTILPSSPNLVHLTLWGEKAPESSPTAVVDSQITLASLKTFHLRHISPASLEYILGAVRIPSVDWVVAMGLQGSTLHQNTYQHFAQHLESAAVPGCSLRVRVWKDSITIGSKHFMLKAERDPGNSSNISHTLLCISPGAFHSTSVTLCMEHDIEEALMGEYLAAAHHAFPHVAQLAVPAKFASIWTQTLSEPRNTGWRFPSLSNIVIHGSPPSPGLLRDVLDIARMRNVGGKKELETIYFVPRAIHYTPGFHNICGEYEGIVAIKCDAPALWPKGPELRRYFELAARGAPLCPPVQASGWVVTRSEDEFQMNTSI